MHVVRSEAGRGRVFLAATPPGKQILHPEAGRWASVSFGCDFSIVFAPEVKYKLL